MIQRIQSVYFLLAGLFPAFTFCAPMAQYVNREGETVYGMNAWALTDMEGAALSHPWGMMLFALIVLVFAGVCIFAYKNRMRQLALSNLLLTFVLIFGLAYVAYGYSYGTSFGLSFLPQWGLVFPFLSFVFVLLARRGVRKDEELVRAADRIR